MKKNIQKKLQLKKDVVKNLKVDSDLQAGMFPGLTNLKSAGVSCVKVMCQPIKTIPCQLDDRFLTQQPSLATPALTTL